MTNMHPTLFAEAFVGIQWQYMILQLRISSITACNAITQRLYMHLLRWICQLSPLKGNEIFYLELYRPVISSAARSINLFVQKNIIASSTIKTNVSRCLGLRERT